MGLRSFNSSVLEAEELGVWGLEWESSGVCGNEGPGDGVCLQHLCTESPV